MSSPLSQLIAALATPDTLARTQAAREIYLGARSGADAAVKEWWNDEELAQLLFAPTPAVTVGIAVTRGNFARIHEANGSPRQAIVPVDQDAEEFELNFPPKVSLDILTSRDPTGGGAIARYLAKFGEGVQQIEYRCRDVDRAAEILSTKFSVSAIYPVARTGADHARVNFFLVSVPAGGKTLIELYQPAGSND